MKKNIKFNKPIMIIGNWKLNGNKEKIYKFFNYFFKKLKIKNFFSKILIALPTIYLDFFNRKWRNKGISLIAQNIDVNISGAFTGETSVLMIKDFDIKYALIGHSERRQLHKETDEIIAKKINILIKNKITPILCIGEPLKYYQDQKGMQYCKKQLKVVKKICKKKSFKKIIIAYEPIWSIGTGMVADSTHINAMHKFIKNYIYSFKVHKKKTDIIVQYGGSVTKNNALNLISKKYIDGLLIGKSCINKKEFVKIIKIVNRNIK